MHMGRALAVHSKPSYLREFQHKSVVQVWSPINGDHPALSSLESCGAWYSSKLYFTLPFTTRAGLEA